MLLTQPPIAKLGCMVQNLGFFTDMSYFKSDGHKRLEDIIVTAEKHVAGFGRGECCVFGRGWYGNNAAMNFFGDQPEEADLVDAGLQLASY